MMRALPQPSRTLAYGLAVAWLVLWVSLLAGFLFQFDTAWAKWFFLPFPLIGAAAGAVVALDIRGNAAGANEAMREQGMPTLTLPFFRIFAAASCAMALAAVGVVVLADF